MLAAGLIAQFRGIWCFACFVYKSKRLGVSIFTIYILNSKNPFKKHHSAETFFATCLQTPSWKISERSFISWFWMTQGCHEFAFRLTELIWLNFYLLVWLSYRAYTSLLRSIIGCIFILLSTERNYPLSTFLSSSTGLHFILSIAQIYSKILIQLTSFLELAVIHSLEQNCKAILAQCMAQAAWIWVSWSPRETIRPLFSTFFVGMSLPFLLAH